MNYERKYKEALERARTWRNKSGMPIDKQGILDEIFPELKESEDEKIRKALIHLVNSNKELSFGIDNYDGIKWGDILAWLEKQGEHKKFRDNIQVGDKVTRNEDGMLVNLSQLDRVAKKDEKQGEQAPVRWSYPYGKDETVDQLIAIAECLEMNGDCIYNDYTGDECGKFLRELARKHIEDSSAKLNENDKQYLLVCKNAPAKYQVSDKWDASIISRWLENKVKSTATCSNHKWGKEDEKMLQSVLWHVSNSVSNGKSQDFKCDLTEWVKSLKERYTWKPSDEQIEALDFAADCIVPAEFCVKRKVLKELLEQLKKLKG